MHPLSLLIALVMETSFPQLSITTINEYPFMDLGETFSQR